LPRAKQLRKELMPDSPEKHSLGFFIYLYYNYNMATTKTIRLKKVKRANLPYFLKWWKDKELIGLTSGVYEKSDKILESYFSKMLAEKSDHHYIIILNNKKIIGNISLTNKSKKVFEIHIIIGEKRYWGKGYGVLAIKDALKIAFEKLKYQKAYLEVRPENKRAIRAYQKSGFVKAGIKKYLKNKNQPIALRMVLLNKKI
jgi:RimJ/RimL family protein N-acetyltransferase